jgi:hypothetical protein
MTKGAATVTRAFKTLLALATSVMPSVGLAAAQPSAPHAAECCTHPHLAEQYGIIWTGHATKMPIERLAAYAAPVVWFSPDEPLLTIGQTGGRKARGRDILIPEPFPFEDQPGKPVVYYRVRRILQRLDEPGAGTYVENPEARGESVIDLEKVAGVDLDFFFYYSMDIGGGSHEHDVEYIETRLAVGREPGCGQCPYVIGLMRVTGKAHGIQWYDNTLDVDASAQLPIHVFVEEGKHASCTDRNADGYFTPGYDVTERVNDAWGVRDTLGTGTFFSGNYQAWMTKVRADDTRVFPPLPEDSPLREAHTRDGVYAPDNAIYVLRPYPRPEAAAPDLKPYIADKGDPGWPEIEKDTDLERFGQWLDDESWAKSWAVAFRADGDLGVSVAFPLLIFKNLQDPLGGGWFVNRIYFKDRKLRDFGWMLHYTQSASRWVDGYVSAGWEHDVVDTDDMGGTRARNLFVAETGIKLRVNIHHTPVKFLARLGTDFWGLRVGIRTVDVWDFDQVGWIVEFGAGSW